MLKSYRDISRVVFEIQVIKIRSFFKILQKVKKYTFSSQILELGEYGVNTHFYRPYFKAESKFHCFVAINLSFTGVKC